MSGAVRRNAFQDTSEQGAGKGKEDDPLALLNEDASAEPLDNAEQERIIKALQESNEKSNYIYRALMLVVLGMVLFLYLTPIPAYVMGTHPENHLTMFFSSNHADGTHEDLLYLPALPFYLLFLSIQGWLVWAAGYDIAEKMGLVKVAGQVFPAQPHRFGTAPRWLVPALSDIRFHPSHVGGRTDGDTGLGPTVATTMEPRLLYLTVLFIASLPLPLMTFGTGSFTNAGWWAFATLALGCLTLAEWMILKSDRAATGLTGMKYNYKGA